MPQISLVITTPKEPNATGKLFRFERENESYDCLLDSQKKEERQNILNGFNFAKKVIDTGECDVLVLDEVLGLVGLLL